jgi:hypothetical protein
MTTQASLAYRGDLMVTSGPGWSAVRLVGFELSGGRFATSDRAAIYLAAEAASDAAIAGFLGDEGEGCRAIVTGSSTIFGRPGSGVVTAKAALTGDAGQVLSRLGRHGAAVVALLVVVVDGMGAEVAWMEVEWRLSREPGSAAA